MPNIEGYLAQDLAGYTPPTVTSEAEEKNEPFLSDETKKTLKTVGVVALAVLAGIAIAGVPTGFGALSWHLTAGHSIYWFVGGGVVGGILGVTGTGTILSHYFNDGDTNGVGTYRQDDDEPSTTYYSAYDYESKTVDYSGPYYDADPGKPDTRSADSSDTDTSNDEITS